MNHYGSAYEKTKRRANTLVAGKLLPESMKQRFTTETNGIEQGNEIRSLTILTIQCK